MSLFALVVELLLALAKALGLSASAKQASDERRAGAALQRAEDLSHEAIRIQNATHAGADLPAASLPDRYDRDAAP